MEFSTHIAWSELLVFIVSRKVHKGEQTILFLPAREDLSANLDCSPYIQMYFKMAALWGFGVLEWPLK